MRLSGEKNMIEFILEVQLSSKKTELDKLFIQKPGIELHLNGNDYEFIAWGDPINDPGFKEKLSKNLTPEFIVNNLHGHYYYILLDKSSGSLLAGNSLFSILPLYYFRNNDKILISDNALRIGKYLDLNDISKRFILETILFNYPLFNDSIFESIKLLPANSYIICSGSNSDILKHTEIQNHFSATPKPWKKSTGEIRDVFISSVCKYLPDKHYVHALTGGFDGRTLVSVAIYFNKVFSCYSFGSKNSKDTRIASQLAEKAGIPFINFELEDSYIKNDNLPCGKEFIINSSGTSTFARSHYLHSAKRLSSDFQHIITGNFGSEIFRAAHIAGAVISSNLYALFDSESSDEGIRKIEGSREFQCLNTSNFELQFESLKEDILHLPCYDNALSGLTKNQRFYVFVFEEIFRKYFGAEMVNQFRYVKNRTPFLDIEFLKAIFKTELAGIHSDFFEHNPFKRYKGQVLYANIIKSTYPGFGKMLTDKGYRPDDLINPFGKLNIAKGYLKKVIRKSSPDFDPYAVSKAWEYNKDFWLKIPISGDLFDLTVIKYIPREILFKILSLSYISDFIPQRR